MLEITLGIFPAKGNAGSPEGFMAAFVGELVLFSASGTGIFSAMNEGITHITSILFAKTFLDFFTALIFAISLGISIVMAVIPQSIILILYYLGDGHLSLLESFFYPRLNYH